MKLTDLNASNRGTEHDMWVDFDCIGNYESDIDIFIDNVNDLD